MKNHADGTVSDGDGRGRRRYLDGIATADIAFEAEGRTPEEMFVAAADALLGVLTESPGAVAPVRTVDIGVKADSLDMLLFRFLGEFVYLKDARRLLLRAAEVHIGGEPGSYTLHADAYGEEIDPSRHRMIVDVKAVTLHRLRVEEREGAWIATVVVDV